MRKGGGGRSGGRGEGRDHRRTGRLGNGFQMAAASSERGSDRGIKKSVLALWA